MYTNPWLFNNEVYDGYDIKKYYGFVYCIYDLKENKKYIGRKYFWSLKKVKGKTRKSRSESDWKEYYSSNDYIKKESKLDPLRFKREILHLCESKGKTNFLEVNEQFIRKVLLTDEYYNDQINGKWYKVNVIKY